MAKLSARGRKVVYSVTREYTETELQAQHDRAYAKPDDPFYGKPSLCNWERKTRRLMSDGSVLEKLDVRFRPNPNAPWEGPLGRRHSYGWKLTGKLKDDVTPAQWLEVYTRARRDGSASPWQIDGDRAEPKVLSRTRVLRAAQSGDSIGFCLSCGAETDGVEPDATGYQCHSCGKHEVSGAEEILLGMI